MNDASATESTRPTTVPDVLDAASALVADGMDPSSAIHMTVHGSPDIKPGTPLAWEARRALLRSVDPALLPAAPWTWSPGVLAHWVDQVGEDEVITTMRRVATDVRAADLPAR